MNEIIEYTNEELENLYACLFTGSSLYGACHQLEIHYTRVARLRRKYPQFKERIQQGLDASRGWCDERIKAGIGDPKFNINTIMLWRRIRWNDADEGRPDIPGFAEADDFPEKCKIIRGAIQSGRIGTQQGKNLMDLIVGEANVIKIEELGERIKAFEKEVAK